MYTGRLQRKVAETAKEANDFIAEALGGQPLGLQGHDTQQDGASSVEQLFMVASGLEPMKEHFFSEIRISRTGGFQDVEFLFNPTRYVGAMVGAMVLVLNTRNLFSQGMAVMRSDVPGLADDFADPFVAAERFVAYFELLGLAFYVLATLKAIIYIKYSLMAERARGSLPRRQRFLRWHAVAVLFMAVLPNARCFSAMKVLQYVVPAVFTPNLQACLFRLRARGWSRRRQALYLTYFIVGHIVLLFFGFAAFLSKFSAAAEFLPGARNYQKGAFIQIFLFANQVLGVLQLDILMKSRLYRFIFGGWDGWMTGKELDKKCAWKAAFHQRAWCVYGNNPIKFLAVVLTFSDMDFQLMVIDEA